MREIDEDELLLEEYFQYTNMSIDARNICLYILSKSKELDGSVNAANKFKKFDLVNMSLKRNGGVIKFNGFASNGEENKFLEGKIKKVDNCFALETNVYRLYEYLDDDERDYYYSELFSPTKDGLNRVTIYNDGTMYKDVIYHLKKDDTSEKGAYE